jgi:hypothetical protein
MAVKGGVLRMEGGSDGHTRPRMPGCMIHAWCK